MGGCNPPPLDPPLPGPYVQFFVTLLLVSSLLILLSYCSDHVTRNRLTMLTLFSLGGGQKVPALTLNVNNFFNIDANITTKLSDFSEKLPGNNLV